MLHHLSPSYSISVAPDAGKTRLIIFKDGEEFVCRKESQRTLMNFLQTDFGHLFKGRLQLIKTKSGIYVQVKGEVVGEMSTGQFTQMLGAPLES